MADVATSAAPTVTIYQNGNPNFYGKKFVVNRRRVRTLDAFLDNVTVDIKSSKAVRRLCTPQGTHEVNSLETLEHGGRYVAITSLGRDGFRKLNYGELGVLRSVPRTRKAKAMQIRNRFIVSGRARKEYEWDKLSLKIIKVYRNGDEFQPSTRVLLKRKILQDMELVLSTCQEHMVLNSAIAALYTTEGKLVQDTKVLENGGTYVAVERRKPFFQRVNYGERGHVPLKRSGPLRLPPIGNGQLTGGKTKAARKSKSTSPAKANGHKDATPTSHLQETNSQLNSISVITPRDLSPDHHGEEKAKFSFELESESNFHLSVSPPAHLEGTPISELAKQTRLNVSGDSTKVPGVFQASGLQGEKAIFVRDTRETVVDKPVDLLPAEEVVDEVLEDLEDAKNELITRDSLKDEESQSRKTSQSDEVESDSDVDSIADVTEDNHVKEEEHAQKAWQDEGKPDARDDDGEESGNDSRETSMQGGQASEANGEKQGTQDMKETEEDLAEHEKPGVSPDPLLAGRDRSSTSKEEEADEEEVSSSGKNSSADIGSEEGKEDNEKDKKAEEEEEGKKVDEEGSEQASPSPTENPKPITEGENTTRENTKTDEESNSQHDKRSEPNSSDKSPEKKTTGQKAKAKKRESVGKDKESYFS